MRTSEMEESVRFKPTASGGSFNPLSMYPVGSIYQSVNPTDPAELFGGTWERIKDVFMMAAGDTYAAGSTGGEAEHVLTEAELPKLNGEIDHMIRYGGRGNSESGIMSAKSMGLRFPSGADENCTNWSMNIAFGGDQPHNNLPPYLAVYTWVRTA